MSDLPSATPAAPAAAAPAAAKASSGAGAKSKRSALNDTAVHVLKGALVSVLGPSLALTHGVDYAHALKGTLTTSYKGETLSQEQLSAVEARCNEIIAANLPVQSLHMDRSEAESTYGATSGSGSASVNSQPLYDKDAAPAPDVTQLHLVQIPGVCLVCCSGPHASSTGELGRMKLVKMRNRHKDGAYEFQFVVGSAAEELEAKAAAAIAATNSKKTQAAQQAAADKKSATGAATATTTKSSSSSSSSASAASAGASKDYVVDTTQSIFNELIIPAFAKLRASAAAGADSTPAASASASSSAELPASDVTALKKTLLPSLEQYLIMFANEAYTRGWKASKIGSGNTPLAKLL